MWETNKNVHLSHRANRTATLNKWTFIFIFVNYKYVSSFVKYISQQKCFAQADLTNINTLYHVHILLDEISLIIPFSYKMPEGHCKHVSLIWC